MALALAEKYEDYTLMISICEKEGSSEKISKYKETLADKVCVFYPVSSFETSCNISDSVTQHNFCRWQLRSCLLSSATKKNF